MGVGGGRVARVNTPKDAGAEQELDLRSVWERIAARWWLPVLGVVLGLVVGFALALGGGKVYEAETLVAMGQPFSPNGGAPVQSDHGAGRLPAQFGNDDRDKASHSARTRQQRSHQAAFVDVPGDHPSVCRIGQGLHEIYGLVNQEPPGDRLSHLDLDAGIGRVDVLPA